MRPQIDGRKMKRRRLARRVLRVTGEDIELALVDQDTREKIPPPVLNSMAFIWSLSSIPRPNVASSCCRGAGWWEGSFAWAARFRRAWLETLNAWQKTLAAALHFLSLGCIMLQLAINGQKCRVEMWRGGFRRCLSVSGPFVCRCLISRSLPRFHIPLVEPGRADFPHPAHGGSITPSPTKGWQSAARAGPSPVAGRCSVPENGGSPAIALGVFCTATDGAFGEHGVRSRDRLC